MKLLQALDSTRVTTCAHNGNHTIVCLLVMTSLTGYNITKRFTSFGQHTRVSIGAHNGNHNIVCLQTS